MFEAVPFALEALVAFSALCALLTATGLLTAWGHTFGFVLQWMADNMRFRIPVPFHAIHVDFGGPFRKLDNIVYTALQTWRDGAEIEFSWSLHKMAQTYEWSAEAIDYLTRETAETFDWLTHVRLPKWAKWAAAAALPAALISKIVQAAVAHALPHIRTATNTVTHDITHSVTRIVRTVVHTAVAFPPWVIRLPDRVGRVERDFSRLNRRLLKVEAFAAAGVFAALLANALGVSLRCVRRGNVGKAARSACGADTGLFDSLLFDLLAIAGVISVVEFAHGLLAIEDEAVAILGAGIREFPG